MQSTASHPLEVNNINPEERTQIKKFTRCPGTKYRDCQACLELLCILHTALPHFLEVETAYCNLVGQKDTFRGLARKPFPDLFHILHVGINFFKVTWCVAIQIPFFSGSSPSPDEPWDWVIDRQNRKSDF